MLVTIAFTPYVPPVIQEETVIEKEVKEDNQITEIPEPPKKIVYKSKDSAIGAKSVIKSKTPDWVIQMTQEEFLRKYNEWMNSLS